MKTYLLLPLASTPNELTVDEIQLSGDLPTAIGQSIKNMTAIKVNFTEISSAAEANLNLIVEMILARFNATALYTTAVLALKELMTNAAKANLKHYLLNQQIAAGKIDLDQVLDEFKREIASDGLSRHAEAMKSAGLQVGITMKFDTNELVLTITNSFTLHESEKVRLLDKLAVARSNPDLRQLHQLNLKNAEGGGLGMVMVMNALRSSGVGTNALTYDLDQPNLVEAKVVFPFKADL